MILRPPESTRTEPRLPYTTLFRSLAHPAEAAQDVRALEERAGFGQRRQVVHRGGVGIAERHDMEAGFGHRQVRRDHLDACGLFDDMKRVGKRGRAAFDQPDRSAFGTSRASAARLSGAASLAAANTATSG